MITICKNCGAAVDETMEACPDCGTANPWAERDFDAWPSSEPDHERYLERGLLITGGMSLFVSLWSSLILFARPWSGLPAELKALLAGCPILAAGCFLLYHRTDLWEKRGVWRVVAHGLVGGGVVAAWLVVHLAG